MNCPYINPTFADCQNCPFDDCVRDKRQDEQERDRARYPKEKKRRGIYNHNYYLDHKAEKNARDKERREKEKAKKEKKHQYYVDHPEQFAGYKQQRLIENPRYFADAMKRSRERKKREKVG